MTEDTNHSFKLWNPFREQNPREEDEVMVYICIDAWQVSPERVFLAHAAETVRLAAPQADWAKAISLDDEPFCSQFERIRQVVLSVLAQVKYQVGYFSYIAERPNHLWDYDYRYGYRFNWNYADDDDIRSSIRSRVTLVTCKLIVARCYNSITKYSLL